MTLLIRQIETADDAAALNRCDNSFVVDAELVLHAADGCITYETRTVTPTYVKRYEREESDSLSYLGRSDRVAWLATIDGEVAGQILVHENWNRFANIFDLAVEPRFRRRGIGRKLISGAIAWARSRGLPGVTLETQNINVPACRLYERCGFVLGGFDIYLYRGVLPGTSEIALYWYLMF